MKRIVCHWPSPAMVVALIALFVAIGGTSYAVSQITGKDVKNNSLTGKDIKNIKGGDVKNNSLTGKDIKKLKGGDVTDGSLLAKDFKANELPAGAAGAAGVIGATGPRGPSAVRVAELTALTDVPTCASTDLTTCSDLLARTLGAGNWLVQAKLVIDNQALSADNRCGLVANGTQVDEARNKLATNGAPGENEAVALTAVLTSVADGTTVSVRCSEPGGKDLQTEDAKITALQVETVTGP